MSQGQMQAAVAGTDRVRERKLKQRKGRKPWEQWNRPYRLPAGYLRSLDHTPDGVETRPATLKLFDGLPYKALIEKMLLPEGLKSATISDTTI